MSTNTQAQRLLLLTTPAPRQRVRINDPAAKKPTEKKADQPKDTKPKPRQRVRTAP
jgi:hypothetical protein